MPTSGPIGVHRGNPHYFARGGKSLLLVSSGDIYYDVFSPEHDFRAYLDALAASGNNLTRIYPAGCTAFVPSDGTGSVLPWVRLRDGRFDLDRWNPLWLERLHAFMTHASERDVVVDVCLFNGFTTSWPRINNRCWPLMPLHAANNVQGEGCSRMNQFTTLEVPSNVRRQRDYVRMLCRELDAYDNLLYDVSDEPDCYGTIPADLANPWVETMLEELRAADTRGHVVAQTHIPTLERAGKDWCRDRRLAWTNAEYLRGTKDFALEYGVGKPFVQIETFSPGECAAWNRWWSGMGLVMSGDVVSSSRIHAWSFLAGGGAGYLEWSANYHPRHPAGVDPQPRILAQMKALRTFLEGFDLARMQRFTGFSGVAAEPSTHDTAWAAAIAEPGRQLALYLSRSRAAGPAPDEWYNGFYAPASGTHRDRMDLGLPAGSYVVEWVKPADGAVREGSRVAHLGGALELETPAYEVDLALKITGSPLG